MDPTSEDRDRERLRSFEQQRARLMGIAYRVLGSVADAEDVLQETWLRWAKVDLDEVDSHQAFLTTVATRLSLDRLRRAKAAREVYTGSWLPEPFVASVSDGGDPAVAAELADSLSMALLLVLETLSPLERAAFVLREVFAQPYPEVARTLGRSEPAIRQLLHRARDRVEEGRIRFEADRSTHRLVVERFLIACQSADLDALWEVLAPDVVIVSDGGGVAKAPVQPVYGSDRVGWLLVGIAQKVPAGTEFSLETFNGRTGIVARLGGVAISAMAVRVEGTAVQSLQLLANPAKLWPLQEPQGRAIL